MSLIKLNGRLLKFRGTTPPTPPTPTYEYILLQNFVPGHIIGTIDTSWSRTIQDWITTVLYPDWDHDDYEYGDNYEDIWSSSINHDLLDSTVGATLIDTTTPIDFSNYGITTGTPYGMITGNGDEYRLDLIFSLDSELFNPKNVTFELFAMGRTQYNGSLYYSTNGSETIMTLGRSYNKQEDQNCWSIFVDINTDRSEDQISLMIDRNDYGVYTIGAVSSNSNNFLDSGLSISNWVAHWHHYAMTIDGTNIYLFIDGKKYIEVPISTNIEFTYKEWEGSSRVTRTYSGTIEGIIKQIEPYVLLKGINGNQYSFDAGYAQVAVCTECKWTDDFTPSTTAY